jgi:viologen exporter family transport system ATP-binding protein
MATVVELRGVRKSFQRRLRSATFAGLLTDIAHPRRETITALGGIDLAVEAGEMVAYAGPNGAGKSTTIKLLAGLLAPDSGTVRALGADPVRDRVRYVGKIGVVFGQRTELWWDHPVAASFVWRKAVWNIPDDVYRRSLGFARELLGLDPFWSASARELSLGQRMRADLALALVGEPQILFLDEPTIGLDVLVKQDVLEAIRTLNRERAMTVMITSHDMPDLEQLRARIVLLNEGAIAFDGSFEELRRRLGDRRRLVVETDSASPPALPGATHLGTEGMRHSYAFDATATPIPQLLAAAAERANLVDVETHRAPIEDVIADLYRDWRGA